LEGLVALLSKDVVFHSDGGGKAPALPNPVRGTDNVARAILGALQRLVPADLVRRVSEINGQPVVVVYVRGRPYAVLTVDVADGLIQNIYVVSNPEKLERFPGLPTAPF
jgi:RNA polymerase sigma-70 factor (ECF subfamily)